PAPVNPPTARCPRTPHAHPAGPGSPAVGHDRPASTCSAAIAGFPRIPTAGGRSRPGRTFGAAALRAVHVRVKKRRRYGTLAGGIGGGHDSGWGGWFAGRDRGRRVGGQGG